MECGDSSPLWLERSDAARAPEPRTLSPPRRSAPTESGDESPHSTGLARFGSPRYVTRRHVPLTEVILTHGGAELARATLAPGEYIIGREPGVHLHADTPLLSRQHARLTINYDHLLREDLGSSNGTYVNDQPAAEATRLFPNQSIRLAEGLPETVKKYPLPVLLTVFQKVCDALAFAHSKGVIHKPENLMLGDFGSVLVMDWGLAKVIGKKDAPGVDVTRSAVLSARSAEPELSGTMAGSIMGTPAYMSPEQKLAFAIELAPRLARAHLLRGHILQTLLRFPDSRPP